MNCLARPIRPKKWDAQHRRALVAALFIPIGFDTLKFGSILTEELAEGKDSTLRSGIRLSTQTLVIRTCRRATSALSGSCAVDGDNKRRATAFEPQVRFVALLPCWPAARLPGLTIVPNPLVSC